MSYLPLIAPLLGGVGLFLVGMRMMTDGLKLAAGEALADLLRVWTSSTWRGLAVGALITTIVQSSSAVTVATLGFVNAGLLNLRQAVWLVFGANVGTTMTGWLVALIGIKFDPASLALPLLGVGALTGLMASGRSRLGGAATACVGFGAFFLGVSVLQAGFSIFAQTWSFSGGVEAGAGVLLSYALAGAAITVITQSSSAAVAVVLTAAAGGAVPLEAAAAAVVGTNVGTTSTAVFAAIGATAAARRVAAAHIAFNVMTGAVALALLPVLLAMIDSALSALSLAIDAPTRLAVFHTVFNLLGVALMIPTAPWLVRRLSAMFITPAEDLSRPRHLDPTLLSVPSVAIRGLALELERLRDLGFRLLADRIRDEGRTQERRTMQVALAALSGEVRKFIAALQARSLPDDVVARLPDLIRVLQHMDEIAELDAAWRRGPALARDLSTKFSDLGHTAQMALKNADGQDLEAERRYQDLKQALLRQAATGDLPLGRMDAALMAARALRQVAILAAKIRRRLAGASVESEAPPSTAA